MCRIVSLRTCCSCIFFHKFTLEHHHQHQHQHRYGAVNSVGPVRATQTETFLNDSKTLDSDTLSKALEILSKEIVVEPEKAYDGKKLEYRKSLVPAFFYKYFLSLLGDSIPSNLKSAAAVMYSERPLSKAQQAYSVNKDMAPVNEPKVKLSALKQSSGEAVYTDDVPARDCVYVVFDRVKLYHSLTQSITQNTDTQLMLFRTSQDVCSNRSIHRKR